MGRWLRVLLGPLPATLLLLPLLFAGGLGAALGLITWLVEPGRSAAVLALWVAVLADPPATLRQAPLRWWLAGGQAIGILAAGWWLWTMGTGNHDYDPRTWLVWLAMLAGPLVFGSYYLVYLVRGSGGVG